jgi:hypothetical protein
MKILRISACLAFALVATAALAADRKEVRDVKGFDSVALSAPVDVDITQGATEGLVLEGDEARLAEVETVVEDGRLRIRLRKQHSWNWSKVRAHLAVKDLHALGISGSGDIKAATLNSGNFEISISGSGDVFIGALMADRLRVAIAGSGDIDVAGKVDRADFSIAGSGDVKAGRLEARQSKIAITGAGDATVWAHESVDVSIVGSGDVRYFGEATLSKSVMGSGSVKRLAALPGS